MENYTQQFESLLKEDIAKLERDKEIAQKKVEKLTQSFNTRDIQNLNKYVYEINSIENTVMHLYSLIGSLRERIFKD